MLVAKENLFLLVLLTATVAWEGRGCGADGDLVIVGNSSCSNSVTSGGMVRIDEVISKAQEVLW